MVLRRGVVGRHGLGGLFFRPAGSQSDEIVHAERVLDCRCRGPQLSAPLLASLVSEGLALADELSLGLAVNQRGQPCLEDGSTADGLFAVGPLGLGSLLDIDLVPEIVSQAFAVGEHVAQRFYPHSKAV